jgi:hypothetical protein
MFLDFRKFPRVFAGLAAVSLIFAFASACLYSDVRSPGPSNRILSYELDSEDFVILGPVEAQGTIHSYLGLVQTGGEGWKALMDQARAMGGDDLLGYHFELEGFAVLTFVYNRLTWRATATVIKYRSELREE